MHYNLSMNMNLWYNIEQVISLYACCSSHNLVSNLVEYYVSSDVAVFIYLKIKSLPEEEINTLFWSHVSILLVTNLAL